MAGFMLAAASPAMCLPTGIEPVKAMNLIAARRSAAGDLVGDAEDEVQHARRQPGVLERAGPCSKTVPGISSDGLITIEQPADSAAAIFRIGPPAGKFHGTKAPTGPTGACRTDSTSPGGRDDPAVGAAGLLAVPVEQGRRARCTSPVASRQRLALLERHHAADLRPAGG